MEQHPALQSARWAIEYVCRLLRSYGIDSLTPELIRQAKFNSATASHPLLQALHDLALCTAAGLPRGCDEGMRTLRQQIQQESIDGDQLPPGGVVLLLHLLSQWGCPAGLVAQMSLILNSTTNSTAATSTTVGTDTQRCGSRVCLLCLAWLIAHARLFDKALQHLQIPGALLQLLPPYPEDTACTAAVQAKYATAATAAQQHAEAVQQLLKPQTAAAASDSRCWQQVQAAAHHLLSTYRAASLRLQLLSSLIDGREKLLHEIHELQWQLSSAEWQKQQQEGGRDLPSSQSRPNPSSSSSSNVLTAFELHLLSDRQLLQQHQQALQQGCSLLHQQLQCVQAAQTFFAWAASVLDEEQKQQIAPASFTQNTAEAAVAGTSGRLQGSTAVHSSRGAGPSSHQQRNTQQQQQQQQAPWDVLPQPTLADVAPLVQQLPPAGTAVAAQVLMRIAKQLQQAAAAAGTAAGTTAGSGSSNARGVGSTNATAAALAGLSLSSRGAGGLQPGSTSSAADIATNSFVTTYVKTAAAAMVDSRMLPGPQAELLQLPDDVSQQLSKQQQQQASNKTDAERQAGPQKLIWHQKQVTAEQLSMLTARLLLARNTQQQQQQQQQQHAAVGSTSVLPGVGENVTVVKAGAHAVPVTAELQRLHGLAVNIAKQLARVRATNKQQLQVASELLGLEDAVAARSSSSSSRSGSSSKAKLVMYKT